MCCELCFLEKTTISPGKSNDYNMQIPPRKSSN